ncbi:choline dehydrogenase [Salaquimonas pukyongi]|uniref:choline dehydrogenase n=1 Tax=Salaquimonas pukyongi TaxID=2712698 RepID=UPI00096BA375|nr:choline dehydrogenase [Salaquimonas pukyongi]
MGRSAAEFDYIIVGAGSAGGFLALRLSEDPSLRILLLEAGPSANHWTTRIPAAARYTFDGGPRNWAFETEPEPFMDNRRLFQPRGKTLGGSSSLNGMVFVRGHRRDYADWVAAGATGWGYEDVLPFFKSMERYRNGPSDLRGDSGPVSVMKVTDNHPIETAFIEAGVQAGHANPADYNGAAQEGVTVFDANVDNGRRSGTARACVEPAAKRPNMTVLTGAQAMKVMIESGRATGIAYRYRGEDVTAMAAREVILSAGAFQSPQLLMLSGIGPADHLREHGIGIEADLPGVGENLQDHLEVHLKFTCPHKGMTRNKLMARHRILLAGLEWLLFKTGPASLPPSRVGAFLKSTPDVDRPDIQFHFWPYLLEGWSPPPGKDGYCFDVGPVRSESRGWVKLRSADPFAAPRIQLNGLSNPQDFALFRAAIKHAREIAAQPAFDFCRGPEISPGADAVSDKDLDAYVRANANSAYHPCGTAKMGTDKMAVTDPQARVHGVEGLRVADASIMPVITNGNINAPSMMIGEKVAHMIAGSSPRMT